MAKGAFRVEVGHSITGRPRYLLVKDVLAKGKKRKVSKYIKSGEAPTAEELAIFKRLHSYELELKAIKKKAELSAPFYDPSLLSMEHLTRLEELRFIHQRFRDLLTINETEAYERSFEIHYINGTTSYEGNTLSLEQTRDLILAGLLPKDKSLREINEVQNFRKVIKYRNSYRKKVTLDFIKNLHAIVMENIDHESSGTFRRTDDIFIAGYDTALTPAIMIEQELNGIIQKYYSDLKDGRHPFEAAIIFHYDFETIHPFADGNGRVGREVLNYMFIREHFPRLLFLGKDREAYISALHKGNMQDMTALVSDLADLVLDQRMSILTENLRKVIEPPNKKGQMRLTDY